VHGEVEVFRGEMFVRVVEALRVVLTRHERKPQILDRAVGRRRSRAPDRTDLVADREAIPIPPRRLEPVHFDVDRVAQLGSGEHRPSLDDASHAFVGGDLPLHGDRM
jgi:hypothetical protein